MKRPLSVLSSLCAFNALAGLVLAALSGAATAAPADEALARKQGCLGCHASASTLVGPAYQAVAARYAGQPDALAALATSIRQGGGGKWGAMAMPPQTQLSPAEARRLAAWVLNTPRPAPQ